MYGIMVKIKWENGTLEFEKEKKEVSLVDVSDFEKFEEWLLWATKSGIIKWAKHEKKNDAFIALINNKKIEIYINSWGKTFIDEPVKIEIEISCLLGQIIKEQILLGNSFGRWTFEDFKNYLIVATQRDLLNWTVNVEDRDRTECKTIYNPISKETIEITFYNKNLYLYQPVKIELTDINFGKKLYYEIIEQQKRIHLKIKNDKKRKLLEIFKSEYSNPGSYCHD